MMLIIDNFDGDSPPPGAPEPMRIKLLRRFSASPDGSEYWLAAPESSFLYESKNGRRIEVNYLVAAPGWQGHTFAPGFEGRVNLAYVTDPTLANQDVIEFSRVAYVAICAGVIPE